MSNFQLGNHDILRDLNKKLDSLNNSMNKASDSSNNLQKKLILWTKVMAWAIAVQVIVIIVTTIINLR